MIWKDYLKVTENASYSKLARAPTAPPPPPGGIGLSCERIEDFVVNIRIKE